MNEGHKFTDGEAAKKFILGGKATFTVKSVATGKRFTFRVSLPSKNMTNPKYAGTVPPTFIALLRGPDNESDYNYLGMVREGTDRFEYGQKSPVSKDALSVQAIEYTLKYLLKGVIPEGLEIWHEGKCGCCGRKLTVPESIESGIGPECMRLYG